MDLGQDRASSDFWSSHPLPRGHWDCSWRIPHPQP